MYSVSSVKNKQRIGTEIIFYFRELTDKYNFYDAVNNGIKLAVEENNPHVKLMPVGKLRKYVR